MHNREPVDSVIVADYLWQHPVLFNRRILRRSEPTEYQVRIMQSVVENVETHVRSGNAVGKDWTAAGVILHFLYTRAPAIVISTGPTNQQVKDVLWAEVRRAWHGAGLPGKLMRRPDRIQVADDWFALGVSVEEPEALSGYRIGRNRLIVADEASGVSDQIRSEVLDTYLQGPGDRLLTLGNPLYPYGRMYEDHRTKPSIHVSSLESPNLVGLTLDEILAGAGRDEVRGLAAGEFIRTAAREYGVGSPWWQAHVAGEFPESAEDVTFPLRWVEESRRLQAVYAERYDRDEDARLYLAQGRRMGVDVAEGLGQDETVLVVRDRWRVLHCEASNQLDPMGCVARVLTLAPRFNVSDRNIVVDAIGPGNAVWRRLEELGWYVEPFRGGEKADEPGRFGNRRTEAYWCLREAISEQAPERFSLPDDVRLHRDLAEIRHKHLSERVIVLETKDKLKQRLNRSPDRGDALAMTFAPVKSAVFTSRSL